jgi:hypothetical protein
MAYTGIGVGAVRGEAEKRQSRDEVSLRRAEFAFAGVEFAPSSLEASGVRGQPSPITATKISRIDWDIEGGDILVRDQLFRELPPRGREHKRPRRTGQ